MKRKCRGYWQDNENVKKEILDIVDKIGIDNFNHDFLRKNKSYSLLLGLARNNDKVYKAYPNLPKMKILTKPKNYYKNYENCKADVLKLYEKYKCIPPYEILQKEGCPSIIHQIQKYHGGFKKFCKDNNFKLGYESSLETFCKYILDKFLPNELYLDNAKKILLHHGIDLQNKDTKQFYEIDRYYINQRVAIEIHGEQHYRRGGNSIWSQKRIDRIKEIDLIKKNILKSCDVLLIEIPYNHANEQQILNLLKESKRFKIC